MTSEFRVEIIRSILKDRADKGRAKLSSIGGAVGLCEYIGVDPRRGISENEKASRRSQYGCNVTKKSKPPSYACLLADAFKDTIILMLIGATILSLIVAYFHETSINSYAEAIAILLSILLVTNVSAATDWSKQHQFSKISALVDDISVRGIRDGSLVDIKVSDIVVGDILNVEVGDIICADGLLINGDCVSMDESSLTGETRLVPKSVDSDPFVLSGTRVMQGSGRFIVLAVGEHSEAGQISKLVNTASTPTRSVLGTKLDKIVNVIGKLGLVVATLCFIVMVVRFVISTYWLRDSAWDKEHLNVLLGFFMTSVTILVVAIPEGLPLAVTLSLAFAVRRMYMDNNLVKYLDACETMGSATVICSDKTGTLTLNKMTVVKHSFSSDLANLPDKVKELIVASIAVNSTADIQWDGSSWVPKGSKTEAALLVFITERMRADYQILRNTLVKTKFIPFSSQAKQSIAVTDLHVFVKGASEVVLDNCTGESTANGVSAITAERRDQLNSIINEWAKQSLRTICLAYKDKSADESYDDLVLLGILGIADPVRSEVPAAIAQCRKAGVDVCMVTGDNIDTAIAIAKQCNILRPSDLQADGVTPLPGTALTGPEFRNLVTDTLTGEVMQDRFNTVTLSLRVLARSSPTDKFVLVSGLMAKGEVVAVTGDGTNDAPALKKADVGFAMGIAGTQVAKDAADVIVLDDNFTSIVTACKWGRNVHDAIAKFLQFQLTVNLVAITLAVVGSFAVSESPLKSVQMLWVNLIMDSLASLALATESPSDDQLNRPPYSKHRSIVSLTMLWTILGQSLFQISALVPIFFIYHEDNRDDTLTFNTFVFLQLFNQVNCRKVHHELNPFKSIFTNRLFVIIWLLEIIGQVVIVEFGSYWFRTGNGLGMQGWLMSVGIGLLSLPVQLVIIYLARSTLSRTSELRDGLKATPSFRRNHTREQRDLEMFA